ncbi:MAG TPA: hypothetical protein RMH99_23375 [Sandaracinaceae bacterium LLY-WYZ-13_1]|nr:hypothetical protein [Sandaracinaceae bacterium LLY-WYZ-13_1]
MRRTLLALSMLSALPATAAAQDGAYGRLDGDLTLEASVGGGATHEAEAWSGAALVEARMRYLDVAGLMLGGEWRPEGASRVVLMADVRPLFLARFLTNASFGDRFWDVLVDSIGVDLGVAFAPLDQGIGAALAVGFGLDVPLVFFDGYAGMSLRLFGRHVAALASDRFGPDGALNDWVAGGLLVFRGQVSTGIPGWAPRRYELPDR